MHPTSSTPTPTLPPSFYRAARLSALIQQEETPPSVALTSAISLLSTLTATSIPYHQHLTTNPAAYHEYMHIHKMCETIQLSASQHAHHIHSQPAPWEQALATKYGNQKPQQQWLTTSDLESDPTLLTLLVAETHPSHRYLEYQCDTLRSSMLQSAALSSFPKTNTTATPPPSSTSSTTSRPSPAPAPSQQPSPPPTRPTYTTPAATSRQSFSSITRQPHPSRPMTRPPTADDEDDDDDRPNKFRRPGTQPSPPPSTTDAFMSGSDKLAIDMAKKRGTGMTQTPRVSGLKRKYVNPALPKKEDTIHTENMDAINAPSFVKNALSGPPQTSEEEKFKGLDQKLVEMIKCDIMDHNPNVRWDDIAGLDFAKKSVMEVVVWPLLRPDVFTGLRGPPKGLLLFGPPGTGKTMIGKAIASEAKAQFFSISASSLTSKWHGEGEKLVRTLFAVAQTYQPAIIFIDEIDSLLSQRTDSEFEASRRIKTEFLVQLDGAMTTGQERILIVGATNRPHELDEAARRRLVKRLYIPLPDASGRRQLIRHLMSKEPSSLSDTNIEWIVKQTEGYSGADLHALCKEAAMGPIREIGNISHVDANQVRAINLQDFQDGLTQVRASVSNMDLDKLQEWNRQYGSFAIDKKEKEGSSPPPSNQT